MTFRNPILGGTTLLRAAIQSPNYAAGSTGWTVNQDGSAEFNDLVVRDSTNIDGVLLAYNGTPRFGNLALSLAPVNGYDDFGNNVFAGLVVYDPGNSGIRAYANQIALAMVDGAAGADPDWSRAAALSLSADDTLTIGSPLQVTGNTAQAIINLVSGIPGGVTGDSNPQLLLLGTGSDADLRLSGSVIKTDHLGTLEKWHTIGGSGEPAYGTGWATGPTSGTVQGFQVRKGAEDQVLLEGLFHSTSATPAATVCTLASAYWPKKTRRIPVALNSSNTITPALLQITTAGVVSLVPNVTATSVDVQVNGYYSLGNVA